MHQIKPDDIKNIIVVGKSGAGKQPRIDILLDEFNLEQLSTGNIFRYYLKKANEYSNVEKFGHFWDKGKKKFVSDERIMAKLETKNEDVVLGLKTKFFVDSGLFVPDFITNDLLKNAFQQKDFTNQILDGYPRTLEQAKFLIRLLNDHSSRIDFILSVDNTDERIIKRTVKRRICSKCGKVYHLEYKPPPINGLCNCGGDVIQRSDDTEEKIKSRLKEFREKTIPAINFLKNQNIPLVKVPGHLEDFTKENVRKSVMKEVEKLF